VICGLIFLIGVFKHISIKEMFMTSIGLAVAAIPEGLPAIVTIMLSIGVTKMAKKNAIIRKLAAVETLGSSSIICSDKTGTLTQNKMQVTETFGETAFVLELGTMCTDCVRGSDGDFSGDPTEIAIVSIAEENGINKENLYNRMERVEEIPFDSERKLMTTIHKIGDKYRIITKGAVDVLLNRCEKIYKDGEIRAIENSDKSSILSKNEIMAGKALRVLAVAYLEVEYLPSSIDSENIEQNLIFVGLIGMIDPPREGVKKAISTCKNAGIKTVMITGDHIQTAKAIAKELRNFNT
jgi:Ca2+-transporting ATPase